MTYQDKVNFFWNKAKELKLVPDSFPAPKVYTDLKGARAGEAHFFRMGDYVNYRIRLNNCMLTREGEEAQHQTIGHEVAHIVASIYFNDNCKHDHRWKAIMLKFGLKPERCHNYNVEGLVRRQKTLDYKCACGVQYKLTQTIVNKMKRGQTRVCSQCKRVVNVYNAGTSQVTTHPDCK